MATVKLLPIGNDAPFFLPTGVAASGYKLFTYAAGTSTKTNTYTDNTGNTANANPIILNSSGYPASGGNVIEIWGIVGTVYKFVLAPSTDSDPPVAPIWSRDNISSINDQTQTFSEWIVGPTPTFINGSQFTLVGDQTNTWTIGRRVQATVTAGTVYGRITASAFAAATTITLQLDGTQALDSGLAAVSYAMLGSLVKSEPERIGTSSGTDTYTATVGITRLVIGDEYKVKIASASTSTTPTLNLDGTGAKTVVRADGSALLAGDLNGEHVFRWDGTNQVVLNPTKVKGTQIQPSFVAPSSICDGRLTLTTATPVTTADVTAATTVYFTPYKGNRIATYDGTNWNVATFTEKSVGVPATTSTPFDVFIVDGTLALETVNWSSDSARATALVLQDGVYVKTGATTRRYLGTCRTTTVSGQTEDSVAKRYVWNAFNRLRRHMKVVEATASWTYSVAAYRQARATATNQLDYVVGLSEDPVQAFVLAAVQNDTQTNASSVGVGVDSTTVSSALIAMGPGSAVANAQPLLAIAEYYGFPGIGRHTLVWLETPGSATGVTTWYGTTFGNAGITGWGMG
jgi:hypothetical protein